MRIKCTKTYELDLNAQELHDIKFALDRAIVSSDVNKVVKERIVRIYSEMERASK